jgi:hypothetical protein
MNTLERFYTYNKTKLDNQINDKCTVEPRIILDMIIQKNTNRRHSPLHTFSTYALVQSQATAQQAYMYRHSISVSNTNRNTVLVSVHTHSPSLIQQIKITIRNTYHFRTIIIEIQNYSVHH